MSKREIQKRTVRSLIMLLFALSLTSYITAQDKGFLILEGANNINYKGEIMPRFTTTLDYKLNKSLSIFNWNALSYDSGDGSSWLNSTARIDKSMGQWKVGAGYMYNAWEAVAKDIHQLQGQHMFFMLNVGYLIKL